ncbi:hypothetical protein L3C06_09885 [Lacticaseibacillus paracasei subsp. paracasei]|jgi:hypothetical protein|uniref:hypothetical protein n=1 Tax=Lacticaseibacillus paracasei TaxID=1597 RepID=UPI001F2BAECE|nr:hypothetical protein [Lacticaseibacillus paracasei]UJS06910.1 hypothetical protein L3C06_09885 [Lacticaseibacillus paracasei subsp. paracasei]
MPGIRGSKEFVSKVKEVFKLGDFTDKINVLRWLIAMIISSFIGIFYYYGKLKSIRAGSSDMIAISSIILATAGIFIGLLIGERHSSEFFKETDKVSKSQDFFGALIRKIRTIFIEDIVFIVITVSFDFIPSLGVKLINTLVLVVWASIFLVSMWDIYYVVDVISKIMLKKHKKTGIRVKS